MSMSNQELIEKLEILQNVLIASVTGESGNPQQYTELRSELFDIPGVTRPADAGPQRQIDPELNHTS